MVLLVAVVNSLSTRDDLAEAGQPTPLWEPVIWEVTSIVVLAALAPVIMAFTRRFWPLDRPRLQVLAPHLAAAIAVSLAHVALMGVLRWATYAALGQDYPALGPLGDWGYELRKDLLVYAGFVAAYVAWTRLQPAPDGASDQPDLLEVRDGARRHFVPLSEVTFVEAAGNYVELHRPGASLLHRASLAQLEPRLARAGFIRIHRSRLVRRSAVAQVAGKPSGDFTVRLADGRELAGSRRYRAPLLDRGSGGD